MNVVEMITGNNNKLKHQGKPMIRRVHLLKARNKRIIKERKSEPLLSLAFVELANNTRKAVDSLYEFMDVTRRFIDE